MQLLAVSMLFPVMAAQAAYQCVTPPVTDAFIRDMDSRITILQDALKSAGCSNQAKVTLFGMDFYPDPPNEKGERPELTGQIFNTGFNYLKQAMAVSVNEKLGLKEFFLSIVSTQDSYQLHLDVLQAQQRFDKFRDLLGMTQQACAQKASIDGQPLSQYAETWYYTYRQMYFWLLLSKSPTINVEDQKLPDMLGNPDKVAANLSSLYFSMIQVRQQPDNLGKWYTPQPSCVFSPNGSTARDPKALPQNFYSCNVFYTPVYADAIGSTCQAPELNTAGLNQQTDLLLQGINDVGTSFAQVGEAAQELGGATTMRLEDVARVFSEQTLDPFIGVRSNLDKARDSLMTNLQSWLDPAEFASQAQNFQQKSDNPLSDTGEPIQDTGIQGSSTNTLGGVLGQAFQNADAVEKARAMAEAAAGVQLQDTLNIRREYLRSYVDMNQDSLSKTLVKSKEAADNVSALCNKTKPGPGQEELCGNQ